ncbi:DUF4355 domain-containing protein [Macrococcus sp. DPC7161]|uniref:DUF4355 domain-containing protein n=1 Tax=Macrococcus sp. DPC7161 TaxID=2507060 RepID=UPI00100B4D50|nr:DUF4355 domain-containing protein [Macrococcus sp. DPC7161]RXK19087.1 DUF4355 domain-containing protein [Macrococcus sp. DPC7161]
MEKYKVTQLPLDLQFFSDENTNDKSTEKNNGDEQVTLSKSELAKLLESERDKHGAKVLERANAKFEKIIEQRVKETLENDKRLSKLSEAERKAEELSQKEKDLERREAEIARTQVKSEVINELSTRKLPTELAEFITLDDNEKALEQINTMNKLIDGIKKEAIKEFTRQDVPNAGSTMFGSKSTGKKSFVEMANENRLLK